MENHDQWLNNWGQMGTLYNNAELLANSKFGR